MRSFVKLIFILVFYAKFVVSDTHAQDGQRQRTSNTRNWSAEENLGANSDRRYHNLNTESRQNNLKGSYQKSNDLLHHHRNNKTIKRNGNEELRKEQPLLQQDERFRNERNRKNPLQRNDFDMLPSRSGRNEAAPSDRINSELINKNSGNNDNFKPLKIDGRQFRSDRNFDTLNYENSAPVINMDTDKTLNKYKTANDREENSVQLLQNNPSRFQDQTYNVPSMSSNRGNYKTQHNRPLGNEDEIFDAENEKQYKSRPNVQQQFPQLSHNNRPDTTNTRDYNMEEEKLFDISNRQLLNNEESIQRNQAKPRLHSYVTSDSYRENENTNTGRPLLQRLQNNPWEPVNRFTTLNEPSNLSEENISDKFVTEINPSYDTGTSNSSMLSSISERIENLKRETLRVGSSHENNQSIKRITTKDPGIDKTGDKSFSDIEDETSNKSYSKLQDRRPKSKKNLTIVQDDNTESPVYSNEYLRTLQHDQSSSKGSDGKIEIDINYLQSPKHDSYKNDHIFDNSLESKSITDEKPTKLLTTFTQGKDVKQILNKVNIQEHLKIFNTKYIVVYPHGIVEHVNEIDSIIAKFPSYVLIKSRNIITGEDGIDLKVENDNFKVPATISPLIRVINKKGGHRNFDDKAFDANEKRRHPNYKKIEKSQRHVIPIILNNNNEKRTFNLNENVPLTVDFSGPIEEIDINYHIGEEIPIIKTQNKNMTVAKTDLSSGDDSNYEKETDKNDADELSKLNKNLQSKDATAEVRQKNSGHRKNVHNSDSDHDNISNGDTKSETLLAQDTKTSSHDGPVYETSSSTTSNNNTNSGDGITSFFTSLFNLFSNRGSSEDAVAKSDEETSNERKINNNRGHSHKTVSPKHRVGSDFSDDEIIALSPIEVPQEPTNNDSVINENESTTKSGSIRKRGHSHGEKKKHRRKGSDLNNNHDNLPLPAQNDARAADAQANQEIRYISKNTSHKHLSGSNIDNDEVVTLSPIEVPQEPTDDVLIQAKSPVPKRVHRRTKKTKRRRSGGGDSHEQENLQRNNQYDAQDHQRIDLSKIVAQSKPVLWYRGNGDDFANVKDERNIANIMYVFQIENQPIVERDTKTTILSNGTIIKEFTEITYKDKEDKEPIIFRTTKVIHPGQPVEIYPF